MENDFISDEEFERLLNEFIASESGEKKLPDDNKSGATPVFLPNSTQKSR